MEATKGISTQVKNRKQMSKQTAIGWLEQEFIALQNYGVNELGLFQKAKEMEKEQIIESYDEAEGKVIGNGEKYYNKTFKK